LCTLCVHRDTLRCPRGRRARRQQNPFTRNHARDRSPKSRLELVEQPEEKALLCPHGQAVSLTLRPVWTGDRSPSHLPAGSRGHRASQELPLRPRALWLHARERTESHECRASPPTSPSGATVQGDSGARRWHRSCHSLQRPRPSCVRGSGARQEHSSSCAPLYLTSSKWQSANTSGATAIRSRLGVRLLCPLSPVLLLRKQLAPGAEGVASSTTYREANRAGRGQAPAPAPVPVHAA